MALSAPGGPVTFTIGIQQIRDIASGLVITLTPNSPVRLEVTPEVAALCASDLEAQLAEARAAEREYIADYWQNRITQFVEYSGEEVAKRIRALPPSAP